MGRITDNVAVITGGASGIGAATAEKLLNEGAYVVLGDIQEQAGAEMVAERRDPPQIRGLHSRWLARRRRCLPPQAPGGRA